MRLRKFFCPSALVSLVIGLTPPASAADLPLSPGFRLTDHELLDATAVVDEMLREVWHRYYLLWAENYKKNWPQRSIPPEEVLRAEASDEDFIRRATLEVTDLIPTGEEVRAYLSDTAPDKRHRLVDRLLLGPGRAQARFNRFASMLRLQDVVAGQSQSGYIALIRTAAETNAPFDELVRTLLTASGEVTANPAVGFLLRDQGEMLRTTDEMAWSFLRENVHCAICHDQPFSDTTQLDFYKFAAGFGATRVIWHKAPNNNKGAAFEEVWPENAYRHARLGFENREGTLTLVDSGQFGLRIPYDWRYHDAKANQLIREATPPKVDPPAPLNSPKSYPRWKDPKNVREQLARWLTTSDRFAQVAAMREWDDLFGWPPQADSQGVDRFGPVLPDAEPYNQIDLGCAGASPNYRYDFNPQNDRHDVKFYQVLAALMRHVHFDLREFQRVLLHTRAYSRLVVPSAPMGEDPFGLPLAPLMRPLSPEQLWNSLVLLGGSDGPQWRFASELQQTLPSSHPLRIMGRGPHLRGDDSTSGITFDLIRMMMSGEPIRHATNAPTSVVRRVETEWKNSPVNQVEPLFLAILGRMPTDQERAQALGPVTQPDGAKALAWSLLNTGEFLFIR